MSPKRAVFGGPSGASLSTVEDKREEIIEVAARLFMEHGYHATSVRDIARAIGISQPTLYYYIGSKPQILAAIHNSIVEDYLLPLESILASDASPDEKLRAFIREDMHVLERRPTRVAAFLRERRALPPEVAAQIQPRRDQVDRILDEILRQGIAEGTFRSVPIKTARLAILGMAHWAAEWFSRDGPLAAAQLAEDFADLVLHGLLTDGADAGSNSGSVQ